MKKITFKAIVLLILVLILTVLTITSVKSQKLKETENIEIQETTEKVIVEETVEEEVTESIEDTSIIESSINIVNTEEEIIVEEETITEPVIEEIPELLIIPEKELEIMVNGSNMEDIVDISDHKYSYNEMREDIALLNYKYPEYITLSSIGNTVDNREIYQIIIGNPDAENAVFVMSTIHGREWMNTWILMESLEIHLQNWNEPIKESKETYGESFNDCCIYFIPMLNPDGVSISQFGLDSIKDETLRENISTMTGASNPKRWKSNAHGVDLNRNFSTGWGSRVDVTAPGADFYNGTAAFTEPESLAIKDALNQRTFVAALSYHSMEGAIYWDLRQEGEMRDKTLALAKLCRNVTGYRLGEVSPLKGLEYNYMNFEKEIPAIVIETGTVQCPLPYSQFKTIWKENKDMFITLSSYYYKKDSYMESFLYK